MIMDDQTLETLCSNFDQAVSNCANNTVDSDHTMDMESQKQNTDLKDAEKLEVEIEIVDSNGVSDTSQLMSPPDHCQTLGVKLEDLSNKVQIIRKEHALLCDEVKGFTADSLLSPEAFAALQKLSTENECLKKKCLEECSERKKLYNEVIELKGNIRVFCRCRPMKQDEVAHGSSTVVEFDSSQENELHIISADSSRKQFKFDHVFRPGDDQEAIFVQTQPIVTSVLDGYNVCIFAYGQTGTGKTYTMEGTPENRGVNYRTLEELFRLSNERSSIMKYELFVSMLEVYNEKIRDLLLESSNQPAKKLEIKQSAEGTQEVPGLVEAQVHGTSEVWDLLTLGSRARSVGSTNANELSSRSHSLLRVTVVGDNLINGQRTKSRLWLVDLAGSERVGRIEVEGDRLKESQFINKSLSALGDVISALASKSSHVPYRNSKLTHMLQSSLGGDCKSLMFVQISPSMADLGETLCSLNFASRVRGVEHGPVRRQTDQAELFKYKQLAEKAKQDEKETKKLQDSLQSLQLRFAARETICRNLQEKVRDLENQLEEERKTRLKQENRTLATISSQSNQAHKITVDKKPPVAPTKLRLPLRRISNVIMPNPTHTPTPTPTLSNKSRMSFLPVVEEDKENNGKQVLRPRRGSIAVRPHQPQPTSQFFQPKRRSSIAILRPEPHSNVTQTSQFFQPKRRASVAMFRPESNLNVTETLQRSKGVTGRSSNIWRTFSMGSPLARGSAVEATPVGPRSSKFRGSPPSAQVGSWRPKHPTVIALQKKQLVWSPLKMKSMMKHNRKA